MDALLDLRDLPGRTKRANTALVVEDDPADAALLQIWFARADLNWEITLASTLTEAVAALVDWRPDIIISDLGLPDATGLHTVERLVEAASEIPLVVLTGATHQDLAQLSLEVGAEDYIHKENLSEEVLRRAVRFSITRSSARRRLMQMEQSLAEADSEIEDYASMVAHDLRAPLRTARLLSQHIVAQVEGEAGIDYAERLDNTLSRLEETIVSMLDYTSLRTLPVSPEPVAVHDAIDAVLHDLQADISDTGTEVQVHLDAELIVLANRDTVRRVLENLVLNAIKFRRPGSTASIEMRVRTRKGKVQISIADDGVGIPAAEREYVMRPLTRLRPQIDGSGFGLASCRRMLRRFGGEIWIDPADGQGTVVSFELDAAN